MAVLVLDLPVLAVNVEFGALVLADLAPGIDGILLPVGLSANVFLTKADKPL